MNTETIFVDLILPVPIMQLFTYRVPVELEGQVMVGQRVVVEFGKSRTVTAVIAHIHNTPPEAYKAKYIGDLLDTKPSVTLTQLWMFKWVADYYMCSIGEVFNVVLPAGLKINSMSKAQVHPEFENLDDLNENERLVFEHLKSADSLSFEDIGKVLNAQNPSAVIKGLVSKHAIIIFEEVSEKFKPKTEKRIRLKRVYQGTEEVLNLIDVLEKYQKQQELLLRYLSFVPLHELASNNEKGITKKELIGEAGSESALKTLMKNGVFEDWTEAISRFGGFELNHTEVYLSEAQRRASADIFREFKTNNVVLFRGITGSGKTEVYVDLIQQVISSGSQALLLLPEIALTTQIVSRLQKIFGKGIGVYHSKFSDNERVEVWEGVLSGEIQFVVGVRSAVFLPFKDLGIIIVDEEHEASYKQFDPAPRYHARDMAIVLSQKIGCKVLLGSATPSLDTYYHAKNGKFGLVELLERYGEATLPEINLVNISKERQEKKLSLDFSDSLIEGIRDNLSKNEQSILFLNRRGYAPYMSCKVCDWIGRCEQCSVSLTYHLRTNKLICHYCGFNAHIPKQCPQCKSPNIGTIGTGTEKIEDDLKTLLPQAKVLRMDLDTTRSKTAYQDIIEGFEKGDVDVLVGTQMISKGLDFEKVSLVGVMYADSMINFPDFRAPERAFQLITQVAGRAGRRKLAGKVVIQTANPDNKTLKFIKESDYVGFYENEILDREKFNYPPFTRLIQVIFKDTFQDVAFKAGAIFTEIVAEKLGRSRVLGPEKALVERVRNRYIFEVLIKLEKDKINMAATKTFLSEVKNEVLSDKKLKTVQVIFNVDAV